MSRRPPRPRLPARLAVALVALAAPLSMVACGGGEGSSSTSASTASDGGSKQRVIVQASNGAFSPQAIYAKASPGVVTIRSVFGGGGAPSLLGGKPSAGQGSGFVVSDDGEIATNAHVVTDAEAGGGGQIHEAKEVYVEFADHNQVPADIVGFDPNGDVALLKVNPEELDLSPLELASGEGIEVGEAVAAIGSPFGEEQSLSVGVISATGRTVESLTDFQIDDAIQTDASINPGNSGGPLLDADARVIGINQQINTTSGGGEGVGFAVPVTLVHRSLDQLRENGEVKYAYIGVTSQALYPQLADRLGIDSSTGALVSSVVPGSPAAEAGLKGGDQKIRFQGQEVDAGGDVILAVDGQRIVNESDLARLISQQRPGETITLQVLRDGDTEDVDVQLGERPTRTPQP
jgi:S1-C subfamily serine protease